MEIGENGGPLDAQKHVEAVKRQAEEVVTTLHQRLMESPALVLP